MKSFNYLMIIPAAFFMLNISILPAIAEDVPEPDITAPAGTDVVTEQPEDDLDGFDNSIDRFSYAIGMDIARSFKPLEFNLNIDQLAEGFRDIMEDDETQLTEEKLDVVIRMLREEMKSKHYAMR